jgi:hypothetical protein
LLTPEFLRDMFRPQAVHPFRTLRATFQRLAHSSIMRLNETSMSKLYDLMVMALKFQCLTCGHPGRVPGEITALHVKNLKALLSTRGSAQAAAAGRGKGGGARDASADAAAAAAATATGALDEESALEASLSAAVSAATTAAAADSSLDVARAAGTVADLVDAVARTMAAVYGDLSVGEQWGLYGAILGFFQDRRVRVSALLAEGLQCGDGSLVVYPPMLGPPPMGGGSGGSALTPGAFKRFDSGGKEVVVGGATHFTALVELHALPGGAGASHCMDWRDLGGNIYSEKWGKGGGGVEGSSTAATATATTSTSGSGKTTAGLPTTSQPASSVVIGGVGSKQASAGLNLLSSMLLPGGSSSSGGGGKDEGVFFSLDLEQLLGGDEEQEGGGTSSSGSNSGKTYMDRRGRGSSGGGGSSNSSAGGGSGSSGSESIAVRLEKKPDAPTIVRFNQGSVGGGTKALKASIHADLDGDGEGEGEGGDDSLLAMMDALQ